MIARTILAALLAAMALGQLSDVAGFIEILEDYEFGPRPLIALLGAGLIAGEVAGAALLARRSTVRAGATVALAVAIVWTTVGVQAFGRGLVIDNCGCFGVHLGQPLRWWVLVQDAEFVALAWWVRRRTIHSRGGHRAPEPTGRATATH